MSICPSPEILRRFGSGLPGDETDDSLDAHINECDACQAVLDGFARDEPVTASPGAGRMPAGEDLPRIPGYKLERELGRGGMGVVFLAREVNADRAVAVKFLPSGPLATVRERERWLREARAAARVRHPHIVQLHHVDEAGGWLYLVLEYVPGGSLKERLTGPLPPRIAASMLLSIARTLEDLHRAGVWHLDLKPANILVDADSATPIEHAALKLADFGIARSLGDSGLSRSSRGVPQGTPLYMAPEQAAGQGGALSPATDIHALGIILYELLTGRPPFLADSDVEILQRVRSEDPLPPRRLNPRIPRDLETVCLKCLAKEPGRRYPSAGSLADDLQRWQEGCPISARPASWTERTWRSCRRRPAIASLAFALSLSLSAGFLGVTVLWRYAEAERARAEVDFQTASDVLEQFVGFTTAIPVPKVFDDRSLIPLLENTRGRIRNIVRRRPGSDQMLRELALVDLRLSQCLVREGRNDDARPILQESVERFDELSRRTPLDRPAYVDYLWACQGFADVAEGQDRTEVSLVYRRRALEAGETITRRWPSGEALVDLARMRSELAPRLARRGEIAAARELLEANVGTFAPRPGWKMDHAGVAAWCIMAPIERNRHRSRFADPGTDPPATPADTANPSSRLALAGSSATDALSAREWAGLMLGAMEYAVQDGKQPFREADVGYWLCRLLMRIAAEDRKHGRIEDSRRTVERMVELGKALVARHPDQPGSFMVSSTGHMQRSKIAWKSKPLDYPAIERHLTLAVEAARKGVTLAPTDQDARHVLSLCQHKLDDFLEGRREREAPGKP